MRVARKLGARGLAFDAFVALAACAVSASVFFSLRGVDAAAADRRDAGAVAVLLVVHTLCLAARRIRPLVAFGLNLATGVAVAALGWPLVVLGIALVIAVYSLGSELPRRISLPGLAVAELAALAVGALQSWPQDISTVAGNAVVLAVAWFLGSTIRSRRAYAADLERRNFELEQAREELAHRAVAEERVRIARELHDVIAHSMIVIAVQSGAGAHVIESDPQAAKRALEVIETSSRTAMTELRRVLGLLREQGDTGALAPAPSLEGLDRLVDQVTRSGLEVELQRFGAERELPPGTELTVYRIVQEALTNVLKHAGARRGRVSISQGGDSLRVEVVDDGVGGSTPAEGNGLRGMRERVEMYGGQLEAGPLPEGGFRVAATLPADD